MLSTMSLVTSIKDYIEVVHKLIETDPNLKITTYYDFGSIMTYFLLSGKETLSHFLSFQWFQNFWSIPTLIPDIASAMISEISIFDGSFQNTQNILENPISYGNHNFFIYCSEKFMIGLLNSIFLCLPTSLAHIITLRRFVMQGLEAGFISGLGTIAGNLVWIGSIVFGLRFIVIPWLSLDLFRYFLGFVLIVKYMWDSYTERRMVLEDLSKYKIFFLTFLLSFTEQTTLYPFVSNLSLGSDSTLLESFPTENVFEFGFVHFSYLLGIFIGSLSLLQFTCWFWENPAFQIYMWFISSFKTTTSVYSKFVNLSFLYLTMICAISNIAYFGLDYTLTNPLGFVHEDRLLDQKALLETAFLNTKASDRNTRRNRGRHGRRERWKRRVRRYRTFDASLYDQGTYDFLTLEDLNYGFDRFWLRRKIRNHRVRFRFFPGPWMRSFKKQLSRPRLESFMGPRVEFFRILFEQAYHPEFHEFSKKKNILNTNNINQHLYYNSTNKRNNSSIYWFLSTGNKKEKLLKENSTLRKFVRKVNNRVQIAKIQNTIKNPQNLEISLENSKNLTQPIYSKAWKSFSLFEDTKTKEKNSFASQEQSPFSKKYEENLLFQRFYNKILPSPSTPNTPSVLNKEKNSQTNNFQILKSPFPSKISENNFSKHLSKKDRFLERYRTFLYTPTAHVEKNQNLTLLDQKKNVKKIENIQNESIYRPFTLLHPLKFYFQKEQALKRKFAFYGVKLFRNFHIENNAPYFRVMMKRFFYYYKPTLRWERTLRVATMRKARRKSSRIPRKFNIQKTSQTLANINNLTNSPFAHVQKGDKQLVTNCANGQSCEWNNSNITKPTHFYSLVEKRASRYRYQIYKDVLQHWYYSPLNRFLLKLDVDSFIRRQPNSYFLTKTDEKFLHLKRQLLSEYYETLRWYSYMQHYSTMKSQIGGTKSLSSRAYNQQFMGTFKKIRHLFNITPSFNDQNVLKFDQPLYNEYKNTETKSIFQNSIIHEELLADDFFVFSPSAQATKGAEKNTKTQDKQKSLSFSSLGSLGSLPEDLTNQSAKILREYLSIATPIRQNYIQTLLNDKNYWELTKFLFRGQKTRGTNPITNETDFLNQEKNYLFNASEAIETNELNIQKFKEEMWVALLVKCQKKLYDQESLKNYVTLKKEKYENQKQKHEKYLKNRLERMKKSFTFIDAPLASHTSNRSAQANFKSFDTLGNYTSSIQKAMKESIFWSRSEQAKKTNIRNNRPTVYMSITEKESGVLLSSLASNAERYRRQDQILNPQKIRNVLFTNALKNSVKNKALEILAAENVLSKSLSKAEKDEQTIKFRPLKDFLWNTLRFPFSTSVFNKTNSNLQENKSFFNKITTPFSFISKIASLTHYGIQETPNKNLDFWKKRENALSKRRKIRKTLKRLRTQNPAAQKIVFENRDYSKANRQKRDLLSTTTANLTWTKPLQDKRKNSWKNYYSSESSAFSFEKKFLRKRSRLRRYSSFKGRGPIKKRTLREKLKRQFKSLKKYKTTSTTLETTKIQNERKLELIQYITGRTASPLSSQPSQTRQRSLFVKRDQKQRRTRQIKHRVWKKKKQNFAQKRRKLRKRRRSTLSKIRVFNKKLQRIVSKKEIQTWWWQTFFPNFQAITEKNWQIHKNKQIRKQFNELSEKEILERDQSQQIQQTQSDFYNQILQIGDKDYKPLAVPEALRIRDQLIQQELLRFTTQTSNNSNMVASTVLNQNIVNTNLQTSDQKTTFLEKFTEKISTTTQRTETNTELFSSKNKERVFPILNTSQNGKFFVGTNPIPFYVGWDESLRKFVMTNRLLSRKGCFSYSQKGMQTFFKDKISIANSNSPNVIDGESKESNNFVTEYSKAPLQGMNAATTLYWQIPFTTYDPDQFFALGMDGFSPLGWRNFSFKHSKQTTKPILVKNFFSWDGENIRRQNNTSNLSKNLFIKILKNTQKTKLFSSNQNNLFNEFEKLNGIGFSRFAQKTEIDKNFEYRRILKKQKRIKKHPRPPVWFPSGALAQQVLPVHYIYVFYKRSRLPRDRYIRRRLRSTFLKETSLQNEKNAVKMTDFTLRKRVKPRRKYHRKRFVLETNTLVLRRRKFRTFHENDLNRPSSKIFISSLKQEKRNIQSKQRRKITDSKQTTENLRLRQLRRRVQRQVFRPIWRYKPRSGGFVWPGDYLRLELVKAPFLNTGTILSTENPEISKPQAKETKIRKKKRRTIQEWQIQPKKYLLEKHNMKVLKKRFEKSMQILKV